MLSRALYPWLSLGRITSLLGAPCPFRAANMRSDCMGYVPTTRGDQEVARPAAVTRAACQVWAAKQQEPCWAPQDAQHSKSQLIAGDFTHLLHQEKVCLAGCASARSLQPPCLRLDACSAYLCCCRPRRGSEVWVSGSCGLAGRGTCECRCLLPPTGYAPQLESQKVSMSCSKVGS